jgi:hypothetical protein
MAQKTVKEAKGNLLISFDPQFPNKIGRNGDVTINIFADLDHLAAKKWMGFLKTML